MFRQCGLDDPWLGERMPRGPKGEIRPADAIGCAVLAARIATVEIDEKFSKPSGRVRSGKSGAAAPAASLTKQERSKIASKAAQARWE